MDFSIWAGHITVEVAINLYYPTTWLMCSKGSRFQRYANHTLEEGLPQGVPLRFRVISMSRLYIAFCTSFVGLITVGSFNEFIFSNFVSDVFQGIRIPEVWKAYPGGGTTTGCTSTFPVHITVKVLYWGFVQTLWLVSLSRFHWIHIIKLREWYFSRGSCPYDVFAIAKIILTNFPGISLVAGTHAKTFKSKIKPYPPKNETYSCRHPSERQRGLIKIYELLYFYRKCYIVNEHERQF